ncbi:hypothetical protein Agub_g278, partial [Astrephomene gubernaculifera]
RAARDAYDRFLKAVSSAIDGEHSPPELRSLALLVWRRWGALPPPDTARGRPMGQALRPHREALQAQLGPVVKEAAMTGLWEALGALRNAAVAVGKEPAAGARGGAGAGGQG